MGNKYKYLLVILSFFSGLIFSSFYTNFVISRNTYNIKSLPGWENLNNDLFWTVWEIINTQYVDKDSIDKQKIFYGAISGMLAVIGDPYTIFLPPDDHRNFQEALTGEYQGTGIILQRKGEYGFVLKEILVDSPAYNAGIKKEDQLVKINQSDFRNLSLSGAQEKLKGLKDPDIRLELLRSGDKKKYNVTLTKETFIVKSVTYVESKTKSNKLIGVIKVSRFGKKTIDEWDSVLADSSIKQASGLVLDLRDNLGGYLGPPVHIASEFIKEQEIVIQEDNKGARQISTNDHEGRLREIPLVVLINHDSTSATEFLAGCMQLYKRGILLGEKSHGKGTMQRIYDLNKAGLHITTTRWFLPNGRSIDKIGLTPDIQVDNSKASHHEDEQLEKAIEILN